MPDAPVLHVIALLRARPGREAQLRALAEGLLAPTRAEPGCLRYELIVDPDDPAQLTFVEEWESEEALAAHLETPHLREALSLYDEWLEGGLSLRRGHRVG